MYFRIPCPEKMTLNPPENSEECSEEIEDAIKKGFDYGAIVTNHWNSDRHAADDIKLWKVIVGFDKDTKNQTLGKNAFIRVRAVVSYTGYDPRKGLEDSVQYHPSELKLIYSSHSNLCKDPR